MATYLFETITEAQALAYNAGADQLVFGGVGERAATTSVIFTPATATSAATVTLISGLTGRAVTFSNSIATGTAAEVVFPDSS